MRILFVDDNLPRTHKFTTAFRSENVIIDTAFGNYSAIDLLEDNAYDIVSLDHDLGELNFVKGQPVCSNTIEPTVKWLYNHMSKSGRSTIIVHSHNPIGAGYIRQHLAQAHYVIEWHPFGPFYFSFMRDLINRISKKK